MQTAEQLKSEISMKRALEKKILIFLYTVGLGCVVLAFYLASNSDGPDLVVFFALLVPAAVSGTWWQFLIVNIKVSERNLRLQMERESDAT